MRTALLALCAMLLATTGLAQESGPTFVPLKLAKTLSAADAPTRSGYAFDSPRVLAQQRIFGLAHGIALLAAACRSTPAGAESQAAYAAWRARQGRAIAAAATDISAYYFGAGIADWQSLAQKMALKETLDYAPDAPELQAACATLPAALARPRYNLAARLQQEELLARVVAATVIEARDRHCRTRLVGIARHLHEVRYDAWREINLPLLQQAGAALERDWPEDAPAASYAAWLTDLRHDTRAGGSEADCLAFSASLKQPATALRNVFQMPPQRDASPN